MTLDGVITSEFEDFLNACDTTILSSSEGHDEISASSLTSEQTIDSTPCKPRRRGRKKANIDPAKKRELDRIKERKRCSNYRQRQKSERESLHEQVRALTTELAALKEERLLLSSSEWKQFAKRQLEERTNSENEQLRLCEAIQARAAYIRDFQELAQKRIDSIIEDGIDLAPYERKTTAGCEACSNTPFCQLFVQDLDGIYAQTDECLTALEEVKPGENCKVWNEDSETGIFRFMERQDMLCDFDQACETLWDASKLPHRQDSRHDFAGVPDPDNTAAFNFRVSTCLGSGQVVSAQQHVLSRRYRTSDRMVFVWQSFIDGDGMFTGLRAGETGWDVLTLSPEGVVVRRTVIWHTPMYIGHTVMPEPVTKEFASLTLGSVTEDGDEITKRFEELGLGGLDV